MTSVKMAIIIYGSKSGNYHQIMYACLQLLIKLIERKRLKSWKTHFEQQLNCVSDWDENT